MTNPRKDAYISIAAMLVGVLVEEMTALRTLELEGLEGAEFQREKIRNLHGSRMTMEAIAAGYAGADSDDPFAAVMDGILADAIKHGIGIQRINLADLFKDEPKTGEAPPPENKAQCAAHEAMVAKKKADYAAASNMAGGNLEQVAEFAAAMKGANEAAARANEAFASGAGTAGQEVQ